MIERNRFAIVVDGGKVIKVLSSHPVIFDIINLDVTDDKILLDQIDNLNELEQLLPYQTDIGT